MPIKNLNMISISNPYFGENQKLELFPIVKDNKRCSLTLLYGPNGSGKSTISKAIEGLAACRDMSSDELSASFYDEEFLYNLIDEDKRNIHVFNEDFTLINFKDVSRGDTIPAILMLGENVAAEEQILKTKDEIKVIEDRIKTRNIGKYVDPTSTECVKIAENRIIKILKENYAIRERDIRGNKYPLPVNVETIAEVLKHPAASKKENLKKELDEYIKLIKQSKDIASLAQINAVELIEEDKIAGVLGKTIPNVLSADISKKIDELIDKYTNGYAKFANEKIDELEMCPICFRPIDDKTRSNVKTIVNEIFNDESSKLEAELYNVRNILNKDYLRISDDQVTIIGDDLRIKLKNEKDNIDKCIKYFLSLIEQKLGNIKNSFTMVSVNFDNYLSNINDLIKTANKDIGKHNLAITEKKKNVDKAKTLNFELAYLEIFEESKIYEKLKKDQAKDLQDEDDDNKALQKLKEDLNELVAKKKNIDIAAKEVNKILTLIYGDSQRLKLKGVEGGSGDKYNIYSHNKKIKSNQLSVGERNAISLAYFFVKLKEGKDNNSAYSDEMLLVIDDPVSSFDYDSKFGIISFLYKEISDVNKSNKDSKILVMSHDLDVIYKLDECNNNAGVNKMLLKKGFIKSDKSISFLFKDGNTYSRLLHEIYECVKGDTYRDGILNTTRRIYEAYSTFMYKKGVSYLFTDEIASSISDETLRNYLCGIQSIIAFNADSHLADPTKAYPDISNLDAFTEDESKKVLKCSLVYIYLINKAHVLFNLREVDENNLNEKNFENDLNRLCNEIKKSIEQD